ncbi:hypothetical protein F5Y11DRAFT_347192 [Daldinia sp. FL1419]|nr:hypothetical protein F5Y11DRAFT_347192 [Daldinia sp. FL1419]
MGSEGSVSSSSDGPFELERYRQACKEAKEHELAQTHQYSSTPKPVEKEGGTPTKVSSLTKSLSKKFTGITAALSKSKDKIGNEAYVGLLRPSSREHTYRRLSYNFATKFKGLFTNDEATTTSRTTRLMSEGLIGTPAYHKSYKPIQHSRTDISRNSSLQTAIDNYGRYGGLTGEIAAQATAAQADLLDSNRQSSGHNLGEGHLSSPPTIDGIIGQHRTPRDDDDDDEQKSKQESKQESNQGIKQKGKRRMNDLEVAHRAPNLLQLHNQAVEAGFESISDRIEGDPTWTGSFENWLDDTTPGDDLTYRRNEHRPFSDQTIDDWQEFKDFDGVFVSSDKDSDKTVRIHKLTKSNFDLNKPLPSLPSGRLINQLIKQPIEQYFEEGASATGYQSNTRRATASSILHPLGDVRKVSSNSNEINSSPTPTSTSMPMILRQEQFPTPQSQPEISNKPFHRKFDNLCGYVPAPNQTIKDTPLPDWFCPKCNFSNFSRRAACLRCLEKRPARLHSTDRRDRHVTFAEPTAFEGKYASSMKDYDASLVDASDIPEPLNIRSCLKKRMDSEHGSANAVTQVESRNPDERPSRQDQQSNPTHEIISGGDAGQATVTLLRKTATDLVHLLYELREYDETMRCFTESAREVIDKVVEEVNAKM